jgi:hypothetical protein
MKIHRIISNRAGGPLVELVSTTVEDAGDDFYQVTDPSADFAFGKMISKDSPMCNLTKEEACQRFITSKKDQATRAKQTLHHTHELIKEATQLLARC